MDFKRYTTHRRNSEMDIYMSCVTNSSINRCIFTVTKVFGIAGGACTGGQEPKPNTVLPSGGPTLNKSRPEEHVATSSGSLSYMAYT